MSVHNVIEKHNELKKKVNLNMTCYICTFDLFFLRLKYLLFDSDVYVATVIIKLEVLDYY